jgi:hypothetical protein
MAAVATHFGATGLHLTKPTFFSRITAKVRAMGGKASSPLGRHAAVPWAGPTDPTLAHTQPALTLNDEYWHPHVDQTTYPGAVAAFCPWCASAARGIARWAALTCLRPGFEYTCLLYLSTLGTDFDGGAFAFLDPWAGLELLPRRLRQVEPALGTWLESRPTIHDPRPTTGKPSRSAALQRGSPALHLGQKTSTVCFR